MVIEKRSGCHCDNFSFVNRRVSKKRIPITDPVHHEFVVNFTKVVTRSANSPNLKLLYRICSSHLAFDRNRLSVRLRLGNRRSSMGSPADQDPDAARSAQNAYAECVGEPGLVSYVGSRLTSSPQSRRRITFQASARRKYMKFERTIAVSPDSLNRLRQASADVQLADKSNLPIAPSAGF